MMVATDTPEVTLRREDLRVVAGYAAACAQEVIGIFEGGHPDDSRPREAIDAAWAFARGSKRGRSQRETAWAAIKAANEAADAAASNAARAAMSAASAAYLHPLADAAQVKHILGAAAYAARAVELVAGEDPAAAADSLERARRRATRELVAVLERFPAAPQGGGRVGELVRELDAALRDGSARS